MPNHGYAPINPWPLEEEVEDLKVRVDTLRSSKPDLNDPMVRLQRLQKLPRAPIGGDTGAVYQRAENWRRYASQGDLPPGHEAELAETFMVAEEDVLVEDYDENEKVLSISTEGMNPAKKERMDVAIRAAVLLDQVLEGIYHERFERGG